jgi:hypothetical protein
MGHVRLSPIKACHRSRLSPIKAVTDQGRHRSRPIKAWCGIRILYSVDYPYLTMAGGRRFLEFLPVSQEDKEKIAHRNTEDLFQIK